MMGQPKGGVVFGSEESRVEGQKSTGVKAASAWPI
jgi:hypothetical protein